MIPDTINICGKRYTCSKVYDLLTRDEKQGDCNNDSCVIRYDSTLSYDAQLDTVLHESIHALDYVMDIGLPEKKVHSLASLLFCFIRQNPELIKEILDESNN